MGQLLGHGCIFALALLTVACGQSPGSGLFDGSDAGAGAADATGSPLLESAPPEAGAPMPREAPPEAGPGAPADRPTDAPRAPSEDAASLPPPEAGPGAPPPTDPSDTWDGARAGLEMSCGAECAERCSERGWLASCAERCLCLAPSAETVCRLSAPWDGSEELTACPVGMHCLKRDSPPGLGGRCWSDHATAPSTLGDDCPCSPGYVCAGETCEVRQ